MTDQYQINWSPTIGDPTIIGWLTVLAYFICFMLSFRVYQNAKYIFEEPVHRQEILWFAITLAMLVLGINKQLDLQTFFTEFAKYFAYKYDWYENRRALQKTFILVIGLVALLSAGVLARIYYQIIKKHILAILGLCFLMSFILIRASSFHNVDILLNSDILGIKFNWFFELLGIYLVGRNARQLMKAAYK